MIKAIRDFSKITTSAFDVIDIMLFYEGREGIA